ncbi:MAG: transglutaminase family protein [Deferrisomatales bacterium]
MLKPTLWIAALALATAGPSAAGPRAPAAAGTLVMTFNLSAHPPQATDLWIPYPVSDARQLVTDVRVEGTHASAQVLTDRTFSTPMLHAHWPAGAASRRLTFSFQVERAAVAQRDLPALDDSEAPWDPAAFRLWLAPTALGPTDGRVGQTAAAIVRGKTTVLQKARALYEWTARNTYRDPQTRGCGAGDVCRLLDDPGGKCADIHSVFVALARAAGVPAREVFGIRLGREDGQDVTSWQHCWAEFYLPGYGWVLVDPGDVRKKMLQRGLKPGDPVPADLLEAYWGGADPYRVKLAVGRDLTLNPPQRGAPVNYLMYPFAQVGATTLDWLDPDSFAYRITYHTQPRPGDRQTRPARPGDRQTARAAPPDEATAEN